MYKHILVPVDDSILSVHTVSHAVELARNIGARLTFFHAVEDYAGSSDGALMHVIDPAVFRANMVGRARAVLLKAELAAGIGQVESVIRYLVSDRPYEAILQAVKTEGCDLVFMASHGQRGLSRLMIGSQTLKVLAEASVPVLVDTSESRVAQPAMTRALGVIQDEHRTLGVVLQQLQMLLQDIVRGTAPDFSLLRTFLSYLHEFPLRLHHPKEERYLFPLLKQRSVDAEPTLARLERQHQEEAERVSRLVAALDAWEVDPQAGIARFDDESRDYLNFVWNHLALEERELLPLARATLLERDWEEIATAFAENGDPRFDTTRDEHFRAGMWRLLSGSPASANDRASNECAA